MLFRALGATLLGLLCLPALTAADIDGTITIKHKLTKRRVTAAAGAYDRGVGVELRTDAAEDPLIYERSHVVIYIDGPVASNPGSATLEQKNRRFVPDLVVIPAGSSIAFPNLDPIFHNVFSLSKPKSFDLGNYPQGHSRTVTFAEPGIVLVNCHLHTNMSAAIVVTPNQWCTRSDETGRFSLHGVPAGKHTIVAWHKAAGFFRQTVTLNDSHSTVVEFDIPLDENGVAISRK
jgi:plastocyanin